MFIFLRALPNKRVEQSRGRVFGGGREEVDDWDKSASFRGSEAPRRATSSLAPVMLRTLLRLILGAIVMAVLFTIITLLLGYLSIDILKLHAPMSARNEIAVLESGLMSTAPIIFGLTLLGMVLDWSDARSMSMSRILILAAECAVILAVIFTLEDIPRTQASWIGLMLPVVVVVVCYWATRILGKREKLRQRQGLTIGSRDHEVASSLNDTGNR
jgi:hypothetical protein